MYKKYKHYNIYVNEHGDIRNKKGKRLSTFVEKNGYVSRVFYYNGKCKKHYIHKVVAELFLPPKENHHTQVNHKDHNKQNNHVSNLEWCTQSDNIRHLLTHRRSKQQLITRLKRIYDGKVLTFYSLSETNRYLNRHSDYVGSNYRSNRMMIKDKENNKYIILDVKGVSTNEIH